MNIELTPALAGNTMNGIAASWLNKKSSKSPPMHEIDDDIIRVILIPIVVHKIPESKLAGS